MFKLMTHLMLQRYMISWYHIKTTYTYMYSMYIYIYSISFINDHFLPQSSILLKGRERQHFQVHFLSPPKRGTPGDSKWPFDPLVGGHLAISKGYLTIPKRSLWITRQLIFSSSTTRWFFSIGNSKHSIEGTAIFHTEFLSQDFLGVKKGLFFPAFSRR